MDVRNGLFSNGSQSGLCQRTGVWTSIIYWQVPYVSLPCVVRTATNVTDLSKLLSIPIFPLIVIYHFPERIHMKEQVVLLYKGFWVFLAFEFALVLLLRLLFGIVLLFPPQATSYVWPLNNAFCLNSVHYRLLWAVKTNSEAQSEFYFQTFSSLFPFIGF
jgi:hypothetical protein